MSRPGDRRKRWKQTSYGMSGLWGTLGITAIIFQLYFIGAALILLALLDFRDGMRGWRIRNEPPPKAYRDAFRNDYSGEFARKYIRDFNNGEFDNLKPLYSFDSDIKKRIREE